MPVKPVNLLAGFTYDVPIGTGSTAAKVISMDKRTTYSGNPYRAAPALGQDKWNVYAEDDHRQERYIGRVIKEDGFFCIEKAYSDERLEERAEDFEEAIELLYALCKMSGYLTQGHENYLGRAEKIGKAD